LAASVVHVTAHYPPYLGGLEKVVEALVAYRMARRLDVAVLTSRDRPGDVSHRDGSGPGETGRVQRLRSWEVAHTAVIPGLPAKLLGSGAASRWGSALIPNCSMNWPDSWTWLPASMPPLASASR